jgi:hypothetical protein
MQMVMSKSPRVSVVMTTYNRERYVDVAIQSVLEQSFTDFEFVIVDDGSTDGTAAIIRRHAASDARIHVITQANQGISKAANAGCRAARGDFIARFDSDDICMPDRLMRQVTFLDANPGYAVVSGTGAMLADKGLTGHEFRLGPALQPLSRLLDETCCIVQPAVMMRRQAFETFGPYRQCFEFAEDYDLWLRIADSCELVNLDGPPLIQYRIHPGQASATHLRRQALSTLAAQVATRIRRATGIDPLDDVEELTPASFAKMGISELDVEAAVAELRLTRSLNGAASATVDEWQAMAACLSELRDAKGWPAYPRSVHRLAATLQRELAIRRCKLFYHAGSPLRAIGSGLAACVRHPSIVARAAARACRGR